MFREVLFLATGIVVGLLLIAWCLANNEVGGALFVYCVVAAFCFVGPGEQGPPSWIK